MADAHAGGTLPGHICPRPASRNPGEAGQGDRAGATQCPGIRTAVRLARSAFAVSCRSSTSIEAEASRAGVFVCRFLGRCRFRLRSGAAGGRRDAALRCPKLQRCSIDDCEAGRVSADTWTIVTFTVRGQCARGDRPPAGAGHGGRLWDDHNARAGRRALRLPCRLRCPRPDDGDVLNEVSL
jgi:hypothetical protein